MIKLYEKNSLNMINVVNYFCGNNLLIIEFKKTIKYGYEIDSLLIINPLEIHKTNDNVLFISFKIKEEEKL